MLLAASVTAAVAAAGGPDRQPATEAAQLDHARALTRQVPLIDGHNDFPWALREPSPGRDLAVLDFRVSQTLDA